MSVNPSLLWERLQVLLTPLSPPPTTTPPPSTPQPSPNPSLTALLTSTRSELASERRLRQKWQRRAQIAHSDQTTQRDLFLSQTAALRQAESRLFRLQAVADDAIRVRKVAEEQRDLALSRLSEASTLDLSALTELQAANKSLNARVTALLTERDAARANATHANTANSTLKKEMADIRVTVRQERERFVNELAERTANFTHLEQQLKDARETYITAAARFETESGQLAARMQSADAGRVAAHNALRTAERIAAGREREIAELRARCCALEETNAELRTQRRDAGPGSPVSSTSSSESCQPPSPAKLHETQMELEKAVCERNELRAQVKRLEAGRAAVENGGAGERLSSSTMSSEGETVTRRVSELEAALEEEAGQTAVLRDKLDVATRAAREREGQMQSLQGEIFGMRDRVWRMARVSLPNGAAEALREVGGDLGENDGDLEENGGDLGQMREAAQEGEKAVMGDGKGGRVTPGVGKRRGKVGLMPNAIRMR